MACCFLPMSVYDLEMKFLFWSFLHQVIVLFGLLVQFTFLFYFIFFFSLSFVRSLMRSRYPQSFLLHEIEEKGFEETNLPDRAVDFYHYSIERRCRRHYTPATRSLERKMGKDERKMGRRRGGWFLILWRIGEGREYDPWGDRGRGRRSWELIHNCQQILLTFTFRPGNSRRRDVTPLVTGAKSLFASEFDLWTKRRDYVSVGFWKWQIVAKGAEGETFVLNQTLTLRLRKQFSLRIY